MKKVLLLCVAVFLVNGISGEEEEEEEACLTEDRIMDLVGCFTDKFMFLFDELPWLDLTPFSVDSNTMRSLKSIREPQGTRSRDRPAHLNEVATMLDAATKAQRAMFRHAGQQALHQPSGEEKLEKDITEALRQLSSDTLLTVISNQLDRIGIMAAQFVQQLNIVKATAAKSKNPDLDPEMYDDNLLPFDWIDDLCEFISLPQSCHLLRTAVPCLAEKNYTAVQLEDGLKWINCLYECNDVRPIAQCVTQVFEEPQCDGMSWMGNVILKYFLDFVEKSDCDMVEVKNQTEALTLVEGGETQFVEFTTNAPPGVHCVPQLKWVNSPVGMIMLLRDLIWGSSCNVAVQVSLSNHLQAWGSQRIEGIPFINDVGRPKCRSGRMIHQAMLGYHNYSMKGEDEDEEEEEEENGCKVILTKDNWLDNFTLPIRATTDNKADGDVTGMTLTLKTVANGLPKSTLKYPVSVLDTDPDRVPLCQVFSDPHIITFDRFYYNNMYEGYFVLYSHESQPYEVQAVYQKCGGNLNATCTCAVAVKSGDDVFVVDKCIRESDDCEPTTCDRPTKVELYVNGELTEGTQIFKSEDGMKFQIQLPHGTKVMISGANSGAAKSHFNVFIRGSAYDKGHTRGLCGLFNENAADDLTMPDGTEYTGPGSERGGQPRNFSRAWRVPERERLFWGAVADKNADNDVGRYCACHHIVLLGVQCTCQSNMVEQCDLELTDNELTDDLAAVMKRSPRQVALEVPNFDIRDTDIAVDEDWEPPEIDFQPGSDWDQSSASSNCTNHIRSVHPMTSECRTMIRGISFPNPFNDLISGCVDDIKIADNTAWQPATVEATKDYCLEYLNNQKNRDDEDWDSLAVLNCPWDCYGNGVCINGTCDCSDDYIGVDCSIAVEAGPEAHMFITHLCDRRYENCAFTSVYGRNFAPSDDIKCEVESITVSESGIDKSGDTDTVGTFYVSPSQVVCHLPSAGSYLFRLQWLPRVAGQTEAAASQEFTMLEYDSACYTCNLADRTCSRKTEKDHCIIDGACYAAMEFDTVEDDCQLCNPNVSTSEWDYHYSEECNQRWEDKVAEEEREARERVLRYSLAGVLSGTVVIITIILYLLIGRQGDKKQTDQEVKMDKLPDTEKGQGPSEKKSEPDGGKVNSAFSLSGEVTVPNMKTYGSTSESEKDATDTSEIDSQGRRTRKRTKSQRSQESTLAHARGTQDRDYNSDSDVFKHERHLTERSLAGEQANRERALSFKSDKRLHHLGMGVTRERTTSTSSQASVGMGAGGPVHLGRFTRYDSLSDDDHALGMVGIGAHGQQIIPANIRL